MENQQPRLPWLRLATRRIAEAEAQSQPEPTQPAQPPSPPAATRQPALPVVRVPVPPAAPQSSSPALPATQPAPQPMIMAPVLPTVQPAQPRPRPPTPPQQDVPKPAVPASNGAAMPATRPSPPPSPKVIKTSTPTPPPSPRVKTVPQVPPISVPTNQTANPEAETKPAPVLSQVKSKAMLEDRDNKGNGNGESYSNGNTTKGTNGGGDNGGKMNDPTHNNGNGKISNEIHGKNTFNESNHSPHPEGKEIEHERVTFEAREKHHHLYSGPAVPNLNHKKSEKDMKIITIAGENIGALMKLGHDAHSYNRKMHQGGHSLTSRSPVHDGKATEGRDNKGVTRAKPMTSLVNSNVQSINNSLLFNSSCTQRSPGVYLTFKSKGKGKAHKSDLNSPSS